LGRLDSYESTIRTLEAAQLYIDRRFQRDLNQGQVRKIIATFRRAGFGIPLVARVEGHEDPNEYAVIDGQTRIVALKQLLLAQQRGEPVAATVGAAIRVEVFGDEPVPAQDLAALFMLRNNQKSVMARDGSRIDLAAGEPEITRVHDVLVAAGFVMYDDPQQDLKATVLSQDIEACRQVVRWGIRDDRPTLLGDVLAIQIAAFRPTDGGEMFGVLQPRILKATAQVLRRNPSLGDDQRATLAEAMQSHGRVNSEATDLMDRAGLKNERAYRQALVNLYNQGRRKGDQIHV